MYHLLTPNILQDVEVVSWLTAITGRRNINIGQQKVSRDMSHLYLKLQICRILGSVLLPVSTCLLLQILCLQSLQLEIEHIYGYIVCVCNKTTLY